MSALGAERNRAVNRAVSARFAIGADPLPESGHESGHGGPITTLGPLGGMAA